MKMNSDVTSELRQNWANRKPTGWAPLPICHSGLNEGSFSYEVVIDGINITNGTDIPSYKLRCLSPSQVAYKMTTGDNPIGTIQQFNLAVLQKSK